MMSSMAGVSSMNVFEGELEGIDIKKEWELIKQKKCRLSARLRAKIVKKIEKEQGEN